MWNNKIYNQYDDKKSSCAKRLNWLSQPRYISYEKTHYAAFRLVKDLLFVRPLNSSPKLILQNNIVKIPVKAVQFCGRGYQKTKEIRRPSLTTSRGLCTTEFLTS